MGCFTFREALWEEIPGAAGMFRLRDTAEPRDSGNEGETPN